jgi:hypothetical protein
MVEALCRISYASIHQSGLPQQLDSMLTVVGNTLYRELQKVAEDRTNIMS